MIVIFGNKYYYEKIFIIISFSICLGQVDSLSNKAHTSQTETLFFVIKELDQLTGILINDIRDLSIEINAQYWQGEKDALNRSHEEMEDLSFIESIKYKCLLNRLRFDYFWFQLFAIDKFAYEERLGILDNMKRLCLTIQEIADRTPIMISLVKNKDIIKLGNQYITLSELISECELMIVENLELADENKDND